MKQKELITKVEELIKRIAKRKEIEELIVPKYVEQPKACKAKEWNEYIKLRDAYEHAVNIKGKENDENESEIRNLEALIKEMLPAKNVWFITDDDRFAVGHETNDWPMNTGGLYIEINPIIEELRELKHQITN